MQPTLLPVKTLTKFGQKLIGLMFQKPIRYGVHFTTRLGIHTCFTREPLMIIITDDTGTLIDQRLLTPWQIWYWGWAAYDVYELPLHNKNCPTLTKGMKVGHSDTD